MNTHNIAIFGCGDFLRWQTDSLKSSKRVRVAALYDPDTDRARSFADQLGGKAVEDPDSIFADPEIDMVALFVPPWIRKGLFLKASATGKHVLATKPFGSTPADCDEMRTVTEKAGIRAGVIYGRTDDASVEAARDLFASGRLGSLALYRQDWIHAYPKWNTWATDPEKNGGPFMDAMIHNLNAACYLMDRPVKETTFFSDRLAHPELKCADTESMVVRFEDNGLAHLFITWAADLATYSTKGNDREHIDLFYLITDKGWRITRDWRNNAPVLLASREGKTETIPCPPFAESVYDAFVAHLDGAPFPRRLANLEDATRDIRLVRR